MTSCIILVLVSILGNVSNSYQSVSLRKAYFFGVNYLDPLVPTLLKLLKCKTLFPPR